MIRVSRNRRDQCGRRISPGRSWFRQSRVATAAVIKMAAAGRPTFHRHVYGADRVRIALSELFSDKCAYCEFPLDRADLNVEHYRPKSRVAKARDHPGYYWLAYDWSNLLLTCKLCNERRRELPLWPATERREAAGKADSFPLLDRTKRALSPSDDLSRECPLLVNPTTDEPEQHLTFDHLGRPVSKSRKGEVSIAIYNLDTPRLNEGRRCVIARLEGLQRLRSIARNIPNRSLRSEVLAGIRVAIGGATRRSAPYAGAARAVMKNPTSLNDPVEQPRIT